MKYYIILLCVLFSCSPSVPELDYGPVGEYSLGMYSYSVDLTNIKDDKARVDLDCSGLDQEKVIFHVDAAQATGKVEIDLEKLPVDLMSFSAHKTYGPKGIGALYVRRKPRIRIEAQMHGGGHERGMRSGTLATHQIVGMGEAFRIAREEMKMENARIKKLQLRLLSGLTEIEETYINGDIDKRVPHNLNISFNIINLSPLIIYKL